MDDYELVERWMYEQEQRFLDEPCEEPEEIKENYFDSDWYYESLEGGR